MSTLTKSGYVIKSTVGSIVVYFGVEYETDKYGYLVPIIREYSTPVPEAVIYDICLLNRDLQNVRIWYKCATIEEVEVTVTY